MRLFSMTFAGAVFLALPVHAALAPVPPEQPIVKTLTWDDCVAIALGKNPDLLSAARASEASKASYLQSYNGLMPNLTLSDSYNSSKLLNGAPNYTAQAAANVNLFNAGTIASIRSNKARFTGSTAALRNESATLRQALRRAYAQVLSAEKTVEVNRQIVDMRRTSAQLVTLRYQSGHEYKGNMMEANAQLFQAEAALAQAFRDLRTARRGLDRQLGLDELAEITATGALVAAAPPELPRMQDFLEGRPDVAQQEAVVAGASAAVLAAESPLFPSLTGNYTRFRSGTAEFPPSGYGWLAGATLSYPLFGGGPTSTYYGVKSARRGLEKSEQDLRSVRDSALLDLETSWSSYATAVDAVQVDDALLESARQRNAEADIRYASGLLTFDNWEVIVTERVSAEESAIQAQLNAVTAQATWEKSLGRALGE